jgi:beta-glucosidase
MTDSRTDAHRDLDSFPPGFVWGAATSGYQIEGGASADGKGQSIWDTFVRKPGAVLHGDTGDIACNSYDPARLDADLDLAAALGLKAYIFSVQWPRIQPNGRGAANAKGLDYYRRLVDGLLARGVMPALTLYHWELPQALQAKGGWLARDTGERFVDYATLVYDALADRVPIWVTQNEPYTSAWLGHARGLHAPGGTSVADALRVGHHLLLSHGLALQAMRARKPGARTVIGPVLNLTPFRAATPGRVADERAARRLDGEQNRFFLDAIFHGRYPADVRRTHAAATNDFTFVRPGDMATIATPVDFVGINYYMSQRVSAAKARGGEPVVEAATGPTTAMGWAIDPEALHETLLRVRDDWTGALPLVVTENGASFRDYVGPDGGCNDPERIDFLRSHLRQAHRAIADGVPLKGYFVWSLIDNFEWDSGYRERFGLVHVDYPMQTRTPKTSYGWLQRVVRDNAVD